MENAGPVPVMQKNGGYMRKWEFGWYDTNDYFPDPAWKWLGPGSGSEAALCGENFLFDREGNRPNQRSRHHNLSTRPILESAAQVTSNCCQTTFTSETSPPSVLDQTLPRMLV